jgi:3-deoxy-D-manno-octulosonic-acid transferase
VYRLYNLVLALGLAAALPFYVLRGRLTAAYLKSLGQRLGRLPPGLNRERRPTVWIHAVSVGEVLAARALVAPLRRRLPDHAVFLSTTTLTGRAVAEKALSGVDGLIFAPLDLRGPVRRVLERLQPSLLLLIETELWPNLIHEAARRGTRVALVNGRISPRSFRRYRLLTRFLRPVLSQVDLFLMQEEAHVVRIVAMGAPAGRTHALGSLKYDAVGEPPVHPALDRLLGGAGQGPLWIAGSTVAGEEPMVLQALSRVRERLPSTRLLLAPRHPERFDEVASLVTSRGLACARRSRLEGAWQDGDVILLDTLGELAPAYAHATVVFVGGSLVPRGGHNILEAAVLGKAIVVGPHMENFRQIADDFRQAGGLVQVGSADELGAVVTRLLTEASEREAVGTAARRLMERNRGALDRSVDMLVRLV